VHQAERVGAAVVGDVNDLVGIQHVFALDEISALGNASRDIELGMRAAVLRLGAMVVVAFGMMSISLPLQQVAGGLRERRANGSSPMMSVCG
jgi:hypothetical protein